MQANTQTSIPQIDTPATPRAYLQIRACGLQRSGNHAIIDWIIAQHKGQSSCFLNNVRHGNHDPFTTYAQIAVSGLEQQADVESLRRAQKHLLLYSYEDDLNKMGTEKDLLKSVYDQEFEMNKQQYLGESMHMIDVLIIRDPFNFFASRLKKLEGLTGEKDLAIIARNWKLLATAALQERAHPTPGRIVVNYNQWTNDEIYRQELSKQVFGHFNDSSMNSVSHIGGGSSFDSIEYSPLTMEMLLANWKKAFSLHRYRNLGLYLRRFFRKGQKMNVLDRWKKFIDDPRYRQVFADKEVLELSEELFGELPETREFVRGLSS